MKKILFLFILLTMCSCVSFIRSTFGNQLIDGVYEPNKQKKLFYTEVPYTIIDGYVVIEATVNNSEKKYKFIFDTAAITLISENLITEINLKNGTTIVNKDINGSDVVGLSFVSSFSIGDLVIRNLRINSTKSEIFENKNCLGKIDGIVGSNVLKQGYYYFDSTNKKLIITNQLEKLPREKLINSQKIKRKMGKIYIPVLGYKKEWLLLDTGYAEGNIVINNKSKLLNLSKKPLKEYEYSLKGLTSEKLTTLSFFKENIKVCNTNVLFSIIRINREKSSNSIGNKFIQDNDIILDVKHKKIFTTILNTNSVVDSIPNIHFIFSNGIVKIDRTLIGGKINMLGIKLNDTITKINNIDVTSFKNNCDFNTFKETQLQKNKSIDLEFLRGKDKIKYHLTTKMLYE